MVISVILPVYNSEKYLDTAIASVLSQTFKDFELIVFNDGSTDSSVAIAKRYNQVDQRVRVINSDHIGHTPALIEASAIAKKEYIGVIDADDWISDNCLDVAARSLNLSPSVGMVYTRCAMVDQSGAFIKFRQASDIPFSFERMLVDFIPFHFRLCRKSVFNEVGGFGNYPAAEDYDLALKIAERSQVVRCPDATYFYRQHQDSMTANNQIEQVYWTKKAIESSLQRTGSNKKLAVEISKPRFRLI